MGKIKLLIADPRELSRESLAKLLKSRRELQMLGTTYSQYVVELVAETKPDVILFNSQVDECGLTCSCSAIVESVKQVSPQTQVIVLCEPQKRSMLSLALQAGARGFLGKKISLAELVAAILGVNSGELVIGAEFVEGFLGPLTIGETDEQAAPEKSKFGLSQREKDILMLLAKGTSNIEIANTLFISKHTVKVHVSHILEKMHAHKRQQAALLALETGLIADQSGVDKERAQDQS
jgi:DNA-binding NarL/FixJ family response regulator